MTSLSDMLNGSGAPSSSRRGSGPSRYLGSVPPRSSLPQSPPRDLGRDDDDDDKRSPSDLPVAPPRPKSDPPSNIDEMESLTPGKVVKNISNTFTGFAGGIFHLGKTVAETIVTTPEVVLDASIGLAEYATGQKLPGGWEKDEDGNNKTLGDYYRPAVDLGYGFYQGGVGMGKRGLVVGTKVFAPDADAHLRADEGPVGDWYRQINDEVAQEFVQAWNDDRALEMVAGDIGMIAGGAGIAAGGVRLAAAGARGSVGARAAHAAGASRYGLGARTINWATRNKGTNRGPRATNFANRAERVADRLDRFSYKADGYDPSIAAWRLLSKHGKRVRISRGRKTIVFDKDGNVVAKPSYGQRLQKIAAGVANRYLAHDLHRKLSNEKAKYEEAAVDPQKTIKDHLGSDEVRAKNVKNGVEQVDTGIARVVTNLAAGTMTQWVRTYMEAVANPKIADPQGYINRLLKRFNDGDVRGDKDGKQIREETRLKFEDIEIAAGYLNRTLPEHDLIAADAVIQALAKQGDASAQRLIDSDRLSESVKQQPSLDEDGNLVNALTPEARRSVVEGKIPQKIIELGTAIRNAERKVQELTVLRDAELTTRENYTQWTQGGAEKHLAEKKKTIERAEGEIQYYGSLIEALKADLETFTEMADELTGVDDPVARAMNTALGADPSPHNIDNLIDTISPQKRGELLEQWKELGDIKFVGTVISKVLEMRHQAARGLFFDQINRFGFGPTQIPTELGWTNEDGGMGHTEGYRPRNPAKAPDGTWHFWIPWFNKNGLLDAEAAWSSDAGLMARIEDFKTDEGRQLIADAMKDQGAEAWDIQEFLNADNFAETIQVYDVTPRDYDPSNRREVDIELEGDVNFWTEAHKEWRQSAPDNVNGFNQPELLLNRGVESLFDAMNRGSRRFGEDNASFGDLFADKELVGLMAQTINLPLETVEKFLRQLADPADADFMSNNINASIGEIKDRIIEDLGDRDPMTGMWDVSYDDVNARLAEAVYEEFSTQGLDGVTESVQQFMADNPQAATAWLHATDELEAMMAVTDGDGKLFGMDKDGVLGDEQVANLIRNKAYLDEFAGEMAVKNTQSALNAYAEMEGRADVTARKFSRVDDPFAVDNYSQANQGDRSTEWTDVDGNDVSMAADGSLSDTPYARVAYLSVEDAAAIQRQIDAGGDYLRPDSPGINPQSDWVTGDKFYSYDRGDGLPQPEITVFQGRDPNGVVYDISTHITDPEVGLVPVEWAEAAGMRDEFDEVYDGPGSNFIEPYIHIRSEIARVKSPPLDLTQNAISDYFPDNQTVADRFAKSVHVKTQLALEQVQKTRLEIERSTNKKTLAEEELSRTNNELAEAQLTKDLYEQRDTGEGYSVTSMEEVEARIKVLETEIGTQQRTIDQARPLLTQLQRIRDFPVEELNQPMEAMIADHYQGQAEGLREIINSWQTPNSSAVAAGWERNILGGRAGQVRYIKPDGEFSVGNGDKGGKVKLGHKNTVIGKMVAGLDDIAGKGTTAFLEETLTARYENGQIDWNDDPNAFIGQGSPMQRELFKLMEDSGLWEHVPESTRNHLAFELVKQDLNQMIWDAEEAAKIDPERPLRTSEASFTMMLDLQHKIVTQLERIGLQPEIDKINNYVGDAERRTTRPGVREASALLGDDLLGAINKHFEDSFNKTIDFLDGEKYAEFDLQRLRMQYMPRNYRIIAKNGVELIKSQLGQMQSNVTELSRLNRTMFELRKRLADTAADDPSVVSQMEHIRDQQLVADRLILENTQLAKDMARTPADLKRILKDHQNPNSLFNPERLQGHGLDGVPYVRTGQGAQMPGRHAKGVKGGVLKVGTLDAEKGAGHGVVTPDFDNYQRMEMVQAHEQMKSEMIRVLLSDMKYDGMFSLDAMNIPEVKALFDAAQAGHRGSVTLAEVGKAAADQGWQLVHQPRRDLQGTGQTFTGVYDLFDETSDLSKGGMWDTAEHANLSNYKVIRQEVSQAISDQLEASKDGALLRGADALVSMWKFTVLPLRVMWLVNNVFGNLAMAMISSGNKSNSLGEIAGAMKRVLDNERQALSDSLNKDMSYWDTIRHVQTVQDGAFSSAPRRLNDTNYSLSEYQGINQGMQDPDMGLQRGAALMSDPNYVVRRRNEAVEAEATIAELTTKLEDPSLTPGERSALNTQLQIAQNVLPMSNTKANVMKTGSTMVRGGYRANAAIDSMFRAAVFDIENTRGLNKAGQDYRASRAQDRTAPLDADGQAYVDGVASDVENGAIERTLKALGDFTNLNYIEKAWIKRAIPFYPWLRHQLTMTMRLPIANPARAGLIIKIYDIMVDDEDKTPEWQAAFGGSIQTPWGRTNVLAGANPFTSPLESPLLPFSNNLASALNPIPKFGMDLLTSSDLGAGSGQSRPDDQPMQTQYGNNEPTSALTRFQNGDVKGAIGETLFKLSGVTGQSALLRDAALSRFEGTGVDGVGRRDFTDGSFDSGDSRVTLQSNTTPLNKVFGGLGLPQLPFDQEAYEQRVRMQAQLNKQKRNQN